MACAEISTEYGAPHSSHETPALAGRGIAATPAGLGLIEQLNSDLPRPRMFGKKHFKALLRAIAPTPLPDQGETIFRALLDHQGSQARRDDVSVVGFEIPPQRG